MFGENEMGKIKLGRALGLSLLSALCLVAVFAASAQAGEAGTFFLKNKESKEVTFLEVKGKGSQEGTGTLLVPGRNLTISCTTGTLSNAVLKTTTEGTGEITFSGCSALNHKTGAALPCKVTEPIVASGKIKPFLHEKTKKYVTAEPKEVGGNFTVVELTGVECTLPVKNPVTGFVSAEVTTNDAVVDLITASEAFSKLVKDTLKFGGFEAFVNAKGTAELEGTHAGFKLGVL
jgi:hypothetical protein